MVGVSDHVAVAMENWGIIIHREVTLLFHEDETSVFDQHTVAMWIAHELGHMVRLCVCA